MRAENIPLDLLTRRQWVCWRFEERDGKQTKVPYSPGGRRASSTDPGTWATIEEVQAADAFDGVGFVFTEDDPICGVDLDDIRSGGKMHPAAAEIVTELRSYTERSPSGNGVHILLLGTVNGARNRTSKTPWGGEFEVYSRARFFAMTGDALKAAPKTLEPRQAKLDALLSKMFPAPAPTNGAAAPVVDDRELLDRAFAARNGVRVEALYRGDASAYGSASEADLALCDHLAFWAGPDPERIDRMFRGSGLMREKWERADYAQRTIERALEGRTEFWTPVTDNGVAAARTAAPDTDKRDEEDRAEEAEEKLPWRWAHEITTDAPETPDWLYEDTLAPGDKVMFAGQPKAGKTTFVAALVHAIASEEATFLGRRVCGGPSCWSARRGT